MAQALAISAAEASSSSSTTTSAPHRIVSPAISTALKVGDRVRVKSSRPMNGWGPVTPNDVGIITLVLPPVVAVSFGQKTNHLGEHGWTCSISDLVKLTNTSSTSTSTTSSSTTGSTHHPQHSSQQHDTQSDLEMAFRLQRNEEETRRVRAEASQKYHESKTTTSSSSFATLRQDSTNSVALHDRRILNEAEASNVLS